MLFQSFLLNGSPLCLTIFFFFLKQQKKKSFSPPFLEGPERERNEFTKAYWDSSVAICVWCLFSFCRVPGSPAEMHLFLLWHELPSWRCTLVVHMPVWELTPCLRVEGARSSGTVWTWLAWHTWLPKHKSQLKHRYSEQERGNWGDFPGATGKLNSEKHLFKCIKGTSMTYY